MRCGAFSRRVGEGKAARVRRQRHIERQRDLRRELTEGSGNFIDDLAAGSALGADAAARGKLPAADVVVNGEVYMTTVALGIVGKKLDQPFRQFLFGEALASFLSFSHNENILCGVHVGVWGARVVNIGK